MRRTSGIAPVEDQLVPVKTGQIEIRDALALTGHEPISNEPLPDHLIIKPGNPRE
jgi:hypothetical protein